MLSPDSGIFHIIIIITRDIVIRANFKAWTPTIIGET